MFENAGAGSSAGLFLIWYCRFQGDQSYAEKD